MVSKPRIALVALADGLVIIALIMLLQVDKLVHTTLYSYGLTYSSAWAEPYWLLFRIALIALVVAVLLFSLIELPVPAFEEKN
jgi:hypothetical protein